MRLHVWCRCDTATLQALACQLVLGVLAQHSDNSASQDVLTCWFGKTKFAVTH